MSSTAFRQTVAAFLVDLHALTVKHGVKIDADTFDMPVLVPLGDDEHGGRYEVDFFSPGVNMAHGIVFEKGKP